MKPIIIDKEKCIGCGKCVSDCVSEKLSLVNNKAEFMYENCLKCGHCYAICPVGAVSMTDYPGFEGEECFDMSEFSGDDLLRAMKSRRTVRKFKADKITEETIDKIIEAGRYCPTGTNAQDFSFTVIKDSLDIFEKEAVNIFRTACKFGGPFSKYIRNITIDDKFFFKGAPLVIVVNGKGKTSPCLASSYMELMAESMGLGVLYSGFFIAASTFSPKISSMLKTPKGQKPVTCLVIGYPDVKYERIPPRNKAEVISL